MSQCDVESMDNTGCRENTWGTKKDHGILTEKVKEVPLAQSSSQSPFVNEPAGEQCLTIDMLRIKCRSKIDFSQNLSKIDDLPTKTTNIKHKIILLDALKELLQERVANEQTMRHLMRKRHSKKHQLNNSSVMTKTTATAGLSIASTANPIQSDIPLINCNNYKNNNNNNNPLQFLDYVPSKCSSISSLPPFSITLNNSQINPPPQNSALISQYQIKSHLKQSCIAYYLELSQLEKKLVPGKNERNRILEQLEDLKDDLIVSKQYLKDISIQMEQKQTYSQQLMVHINQLSRKGLSMQNRENMTSSHMAQQQQLNTTRMAAMNATFVEDAVTKFKAVKDYFFKGKLFSKNSNNNANNTNNILGNLSDLTQPQQQQQLNSARANSVTPSRNKQYVSQLSGRMNESNY